MHVTIIQGGAQMIRVERSMFLSLSINDVGAYGIWTLARKMTSFYFSVNVSVL